MRRPLLLLAALGAALGATACSGSSSSTSSSNTSSSSSSGSPAASGAPSAATAPAAGWVRRETPGVSVEVPASWRDRPEGQRNPSATLEIGVPFTGQRQPLPVLEVFVESGPVGSLQVRAALLQAKLRAELGAQAVVGEPTPATAPGAEAVAMDVRYTSQGGTSVSGTKLDPTPTLQRELLLEPAAPAPKVGLRMAMPAASFDEALWQHVVASLRFSAAPLASPGGSASG